MTTEEKMNIHERLKYLRILRPRYLAASREERGRLLTAMEEATSMHRKSLIRLLGGDLERHPRQQQREPTYGAEVTAALRVIAESFDYICAERLAPNLVWMAQHLEAHEELQLSAKLLGQLGQISASSVRRRLANSPQDTPRLHRRGRPVGPSLTRDIPMLRIPWSEAEPGHFEIDLVHHCGPSASGDYVYTLQWIDVATGWSERVAVLGRGYRAMQDAFLRILRRLPFAVRELHPDNGSEFFNAHMLRFFGEKVQGARLSRSRPYHKNDNRFVEQKNSSLVRDYLGYDRLDTVAHTLALNQLYDQMWVYYNLFQPVLHLVAKEMLPATAEQPARLRRRHDDARTPFDRLCATGVLAPEQRAQLERLRDRTNPRRLRQAIYDQLEYVLSLPGAVPGQPEDVGLTLGVYTISWDDDSNPVTLSVGELLPVR
jgi:hypothetical protein